MRTRIDLITNVAGGSWQLYRPNFEMVTTCDAKAGVQSCCFLVYRINLDEWQMPQLALMVVFQSIFECTRVRLNQVYNYFSLAVLYLSVERPMINDGMMWKLCP